MTKHEARENGFTHAGNMFNCVPSYFVFLSEDEFDVLGTNRFYHWLICILSLVDEFLGLGKSFELEITEEL